MILLRRTSKISSFEVEATRVADNCPCRAPSPEWCAFRSTITKDHQGQHYESKEKRRRSKMTALTCTSVPRGSCLSETSEISCRPSFHLRAAETMGLLSGAGPCMVIEALTIGVFSQLVCQAFVIHRYRVRLLLWPGMGSGVAAVVLTSTLIVGKSERLKTNLVLSAA